MMRTSLIPQLLMLIAVPAAAVAAPPQPIWKWTDSERLARRFDPALMRERASERVLREYGVSPPDSRVQHALATGVDGASMEIIIGRRNPELFMPWELFDALLNIAYHEPADEGVQHMRARYRQNAAAAGLWVSADFFEQIGTAAAPYLRIRREADKIARSRATASPAERALLTERLRQQYAGFCASRAAALAAVRSRLGEVFDRFLYVAIAPDQFSSSTEPIPAERHLFIERGCR